MMTNPIFNVTVFKNGIAYIITARREKLPLQSRNRYRINVDAAWQDCVAKSDRIGMEKFDTAAECVNYAVTATADWLRA